VLRRAFFVWTKGNADAHDFHDGPCPLPAVMNNTIPTSDSVIAKLARCFPAARWHYRMFAEQYRVPAGKYLWMAIKYLWAAGSYCMMATAYRWTAGQYRRMAKHYRRMAERYRWMAG